MFAIVICIVLLMCTFAIQSSVLCVLMVEGMAVVVNVILSLMSVMSPTGGAPTAYSRHTCRHHHNSGNQAHP